MSVQQVIRFVLSHKPPIKAPYKNIYMHICVAVILVRTCMNQFRLGWTALGHDGNIMYIYTYINLNKMKLA